MAKGLRSLIRLRGWQVDEKRRDLAAQLRTLEALEDRAGALVEEVAREHGIAGSSAGEAALFFGTYIEGVRRRREALEGAIASADSAVNEARDEAREAFRGLKTVETAEDHRVRAEETELERLDQAILDEIGLPDLPPQPIGQDRDLRRGATAADDRQRNPGPDDRR